MAIFILLATGHLGAGEVSVDFPVGNPKLPIQLTAQRGTHWTQGSYQVWYLERCQLQQGGVTASGNHAVIWIDRADPFHKRFDYMITYLEGPRTTVTHGHGSQVHSSTGRRGQILSATRWLGQFHTSAGVDVRVSETINRADVPPELYE
ncbi:MAG: hypothetical protein VB877_19230, partial [Pirellulaceae bacterium]